MTSKSKSKGDGSGKIKMDSSRWNDSEVGRRHESAPRLRAWIPAFAGMTERLFTRRGVPGRCGPGSRLPPGWRRGCSPAVECPDAAGLGPGLRRDDVETDSSFRWMTVMWFTAIGLLGRCGPGSRPLPGWWLEGFQRQRERRFL